MGSVFETAFDVVARPDQIQPGYAFYALFLAIGFGLLGVSVINWRKQNSRRWWLLLFSIVWLGFTTLLEIEDSVAVSQLKEAVLRGDFQTVEGCLTSFHPGDPGAQEARPETNDGA